MDLQCNSPADVIKAIKTHNIEMVDFRFTDLPGVWQHFTIPAPILDEDVFEDGLGFDGSSIRGFQKIQESDMLLMPEPGTAMIDPFMRVPTLILICNVADPATGNMYSRDPRYIAKKAEEYLKNTGVGDTAYFGPEPEFFVFNDVRYSQGVNHGFYYIDSIEGAWNTGREENPNLAHKPRMKEGYFPVPPTDTLHDMRSEMVVEMIKLGIEVEAHHHEVATGGQCEIDMKFDTLTSMADKLMKYKYVIKNVARKHGCTATFMPKPLFGDNGSGMHVHQSIWKGGQPTFYSEGDYAGLSDTARHYIGGILRHAPALLALAAPTVNSYHRLVPGYEAPVNLVYSQRNRSAACRIPTYSISPKAKRIEFRCPDPAANGYLAFAAMLMAGLDGVENRIDPGQPVDKNIYDLPPEELAELPKVPGSLDEALAALEADHQFLLKGDVFTSDVIETWLEYKREHEIDPVRLRPHPYEFHLYYDV
jgi:glutamine synthetase